MTRESKLASLTFRQTPIQGKYAAIYVRVSRNEFRRKANGEKEYRQSVQTQKADGVRFAKAKKWRYRIYDQDCNESGFTEPSETERRDLNRLIADIRAGKVHTLLVREHKRLSRSSQFTENFLHDVLLKHGCNYLAWSGNIDIATPDGQMMLTLQGRIAQNELTYAAKHSAENRLALVKTGGWAGKPPYGYRMKGRTKNAVEIVPAEARAVKRVFDWYENGKSVTWICRELDRTGILRQQAANSMWAPADISKMLRRHQYLGEVSYKKKIYASPYPLIIRKEQWQRVQHRLKDNGNRGHRAKGSSHLLTEIIKCAYCFKRIQAGVKEPIKRYANMTFTLTQKRKGDAIDAYFYYVCQTRKRYGHAVCTDTPRVNAETIHRFVRQSIAELTVADLTNPAAGDRAKSLEDTIRRIDTRIASLHAKKASVSQTFARSNQISEQDLGSIVADINREITLSESDRHEAQQQLSRLHNRDAERALSKLKRWDTLTISEQRDALKKVIDKMLVFPDHIEIFTTLNPTYPVKVRLARGAKGRLLVQAIGSWTKRFLKIKATTNIDEQIALETNAHTPPRLRCRAMKPNP